MGPRRVDLDDELRSPQTGTRIPQDHLNVAASYLAQIIHVGQFHVSQEARGVCCAIAPSRHRNFGICGIGGEGWKWCVFSALRLHGPALSPKKHHGLGSFPRSEALIPSPKSTSDLSHLAATSLVVAT